MKKGEVTLYVKSIKTAVANESIPVPALVWDSTSRSMQPGANPRVTQTRNFEQIVKYDFTLPEDQERTVQAVDKVASELGVDVKIIDVTKENAVHRAVQEEINKNKDISNTRHEFRRKNRGQPNRTEYQTASAELMKSFSENVRV